MENGSSNTNKEDKIQETSESDKYQTIFSYEEIESIVKGFILGNIRGLIKINFVTAENVRTIHKLNGEEISIEDAVKEAMQNRANFGQLIEICSGMHESSPKELKNAVYKVFSKILALRNAGRIEGQFLPFEVEERLFELERKYAATDKVVTELIKWLTDEASGYDNKMQ